MSLLSTYRNALPPGARLLWYRIERVLGQGAFGITYLAMDDNLHRAVAVKEYLPGHLARREADDTVRALTAELAPEYAAGLRRFLIEARTLARFEHPNIVRVHNVFEHLGTACMIMQYEEGTGLDVLLRQRRRLGEAELLAWLPGLLDGLDAIHAQGIVHRDIKPANVLIRPTGEPVLLDFGSARQASTDEARTLTNFVSPGYAAIEQYAGKSDSQGPWTDIYGLGATLYRAMAGRAPPDAVERSHALAQREADTYQAGAAPDLGAYSAAFVAAIDHALQFRAQDRPQTVAAWRAEFPALPSLDARRRPAPVPADDEATVATLPSATRTAPPPAHGAGWRPRVALLAAGALLAFVAGLAALRSLTPDSTAPPLASAPPQPAPAPPPVDPSLAVAARIAELLEGAAVDLAAARLSLPPGNNAQEKYRAVLALEPGHPAARQGLENIAREYVELGRRALARGRLRAATDYLAKAETISAGPAGAAGLRRELDAARARRASPPVTAEVAPPAATVSPPPSAPPPAQPRRLFGWLGGDGTPTKAPIEDRSQAIPALPPPR
jgi:serine/threonine protein kinase